MPYEVCYRALLSISVVEGLKPHTSLTAHTITTLRRAPAPRAAAIYRPLTPRPALAGLDHNVSVFRFHPQDSLAGGPPARWFVIPSPPLGARGAGAQVDPFVVGASLQARATSGLLFGLIDTIGAVDSGAITPLLRTSGSACCPWLR